MLIDDERKALLRLFFEITSSLNSGVVDNVLSGRVIRHVLNTRPMFLKWCIAKLVCGWFKSLPSKFPCDNNLCYRHFPSGRKSHNRTLGCRAKSAGNIKK